MDSGRRGRATPRCGRRSPADAPRARPRLRSDRWPTRTAPGGTGECRCEVSRATPGSAVNAAPTPTVPRWTDPGRTTRRCPAAAGPPAGRRHRGAPPDPRRAGPPRGHRSAASIPGRTGVPGPPGSAACGASASDRVARAGAGSDSTWCTSAAAPSARSASSASLNGSPISSPCTSWRNSACTRRERTCSSDRSSSFRRSAGVPSNWRGPRKSGVACSPRSGDDAVGGVLEPGPQSTAQARVEPRPGRAVSPQQREDLPPCATLCRREPPEAQAGAVDVARRGPSAQSAHRV